MKHTGSLLIALGLAFAAGAAEPHREKGPLAGREVQTPQRKCLELADAVRKRCKGKPDVIPDKEFLAATLKGFEVAACEKHLDAPGLEGLKEVLIWETRRASKTLSPSDPKTLFALLLEEQFARLSFDLRKGPASQRPLDRGLPGDSQIDDGEPAFGDDIDPSVFPPASAEFTLAREILRNRGAKTFFFSAEALAAFKKIVTLYPNPLYPLENLCGQTPRAEGSYLRDPRATLGAFLTGTYFLKQQQGKPGKDFLSTGSLGNLTGVIRELGGSRRAGFHQTELKNNVVVPFLQQQLEHGTPGDFVAESGGKSRDTSFQQAKMVAPELLNRLAHLARAPELREPAFFSNVALLTRQLSSSQTLQLVIAGRCESGEGKQGAVPIIGRPDSKGVIQPLKTIPDDWYYEVDNGSGKKVKHVNGFYDRGNFVWDAASNTTRINVKIPPRDFEKERGLVDYYVKVRCNHRWLTHKLTISLEHAKDAEEVVKNIKGASGPSYDIADADGVRKTLIASGYHTRPAYIVADYLKDRKFKCELTKIDDLKAEFFAQMKMKGKDKVDFFLKDAHANGDDHQAGPFNLDAAGVRYVCRKEITDRKGKKVVAEVVVIGAEDHREESEHPPMARLDYNEFMSAIRDRGKDSPFFMGNLSCWSLGKCGFELALAKDPKLQFMAATCTSANMCTHGAYPQSDSTFAMLEAFLENQTYAEMEKNYRIFKKEKIILPHHKDYVERLADAVRVYFNRTPPQIQLHADEPDLDHFVGEWARTGLFSPELIDGDRKAVRVALGQLTAEKGMTPAKKANLESLSALLAAADALRSGQGDFRSASPELLGAFLGSNAAGDLKAQVIHALSLRSDPKSIRVLQAALENKDGDLRALAAYSLGKIGAPALPALIQTLHRSRGREFNWSQGYELHLAALQALEQMGTAAAPAIPALLQGSMVQGPQLVRSIKSAGLDPVAVFSKRLKEKPDLAAIQMISTLGPEARAAVPDLIRILDTDTGSVLAIPAMSALQQMKAEAKPAIPTLVRILASGKKNAQLMAAETLRDLGPDAAVAIPALLGLWKNGGTDAVMYLGAAAKLGANGDPAVLEALRAAMKSKGIPNRGMVLQLLPEMGAAARPLVAELVQEWARLHEAQLARSLASAGAVFAGGIIGPAVLFQHDTAPESDEYSIARALGRMGKVVVPDLVKFSKTARSPVRGELMRLAAELGPAAEPLVPFFLEGTKNESKEARMNALEVLGRVGAGARAGVPRLIEMLAKDKEAGYLAAWALGQIGPEAKAAIPLLTEKLSSASEAESVNAAEALLRIGGKPGQEGLKTLLTHLKKVNQPTPVAGPPPGGPLTSERIILDNLEASLSASFAPPSESVTDSSPRQSSRSPAQLQAVRAFSRLGALSKDAAPQLLDALARPELAPMASETLRAIGEPALPALSKALGAKEPEVRREAVRLLAALDTKAKGTAPDLEFLARHDKDLQVRELAIFALKRVQGIGDPNAGGPGGGWGPAGIPDPPF